MYLDTAERSAICHYLGIIYTRLIAQKLYGIDCMVPLNLIEQPGEKKFVKYNGAYRQDLIGYGKQNAWSVWEPEQPGGLWKRMPGGVGDREDQ